MSRLPRDEHGNVRPWVYIALGAIFAVAVGCLVVAALRGELL